MAARRGLIWRARARSRNACENARARSGNARGYSVMRGQMHRRPSRPGPMPSWWGSLTGRSGVGIAAGGAALGALITVLAGTGPGPVLGVSLVAATLAAALAIQPRAVYRIIPVPPLAYGATATVAGVIGDRVASA